MATLSRLYHRIRSYLVRVQINVFTDFGCTLFPIACDRIGIDWWYKGDTVIWTWPWRRKGRAKWISMGFSGNGDFGDARFNTLAEMDAMWTQLGEACCGGSRFIAVPGQDAADYVEFDLIEVIPDKEAKL